MQNKLLEQSRVEFLCQTDMLDTRSTMKTRYTRNMCNCPHCIEGSCVGVLQTASHLMQCRAYEDLRYGKDPELVVEDRAPYLLKVVLRRKDLEEQLSSRSKN